MFTHRSFFMFKVGAIIVGSIFLIGGILGIYEGIADGMNATGWFINLFMAILGIALIVGCIFIQKILGNENAGKKDESIHVTYDISYQEQIQPLDTVDTLRKYMYALKPDEEISIHLTPEYFGLVDWRFVKKKNKYISFVWIRKKDKLTQYFIVPQNNVEDAITPFREVFEEHKAVDTSNLISMNRYQGVLEVYKLN